MIISGKDRTHNNQCTRKRLGDLKHYAIHTIRILFKCLRITEIINESVFYLVVHTCDELL